MILEKFAYFFALILGKQNVTDFSIIFLITTARHWKFLHIVSTVPYQTMIAHQCPLSLHRPLLDI